MKHALSLVLTAVALFGATSPGRAADPKPLKALLIVGGCWIATRSPGQTPPG